MTVVDRAGPRPLRMTLEYHETFGHWFVPNLRAYVPHERSHYAVVTNSRGMRSSREYAPSSDGRRRVLVFGDSFTAGDGVNNEERFTDLLEANDDGLEVLNFGLSGSGTDQQLLVCQHFAPQFGGDVILVCPLVENINRIAARYRPVIERNGVEPMILPKPYFTLEGGRLALHGVPVSRVRFVLGDAPPDVLAQTDLGGRLRGASRLVNRYLFPFKDWLIRLTRFDPYPQYASPDHPHWRLMKAILREFAAAAGGREVVVVPLPTYHYIEKLARPTYLARFEALARELPGVHVVNLLDEFWRLSHAERRACRYAHDIHYTPLAHRVVERAVRRALHQRRLL